MPAGPGGHRRPQIDEGPLSFAVPRCGEMSALGHRVMDISIFDPVPTQLFPADRRSILAVQSAVAEHFGEYSYLEIGSYLGGSLQPHLIDERCSAIFSIDPRPRAQPDERGLKFEYPDNTTERMINALRPTYSDHLGKLRTFDSDASEVDPASFTPPPTLCFVDGEHTDRAVYRDFQVCLRASRHRGAILFDDAHIVYRGIAECIRSLREQNISHRAYFLPRKIGVIELGDAGLHRSPLIAELLATQDAYLYLGETLDPYRRRLLRLLELPGVRQLRGWRARLLSGGRPSGGTRAAR